MLLKKSLVAKIHNNTKCRDHFPWKQYLFCTKKPCCTLKYIFTPRLYLQGAFVTEAKVSTRVHWCSSGGRTAPACHSECGRLSGVGVGVQRHAAAAANAGGTKVSHKRECAPAPRRHVRCAAGAGEVLTKAGLRSPQQRPSRPCSCCWWSGWSSSGRTSCLHHTPAACCLLVAAACCPSDPSCPSLSSKSGPRSPESLPFPPLDSSSSAQNKNKVWMCLRQHRFVCWRC